MQISFINNDKNDSFEFFNLYFTIVNSFENAPHGFYPLKIINLYLSYPFKNLIILEELLKISVNFIQSMFTLCKSLEIISMRLLENSFDNWDNLITNTNLPVNRELEFVNTCTSCGFSLLLTIYFAKKLRFSLQSQNIIDYQEICDKLGLCLSEMVVDPTIESHFVLYIFLFLF